MPKVTERDLLYQLEATLENLPGVQVERVEYHVLADSNLRIDGLIHVMVHGEPVVVLAEAKAQGYPRDVRAGLEQLERLCRDRRNAFQVPMLVAPALTVSSRQFLKERKVAYSDSSGSLYLEVPWALYYVDREVPPGQQRRLTSVYRGSAAQVLHALLLEPNSSWSVTELAAQAEVSPATVHRVFTFLEEDMHWMTKRGSGPRVVRCLDKPGALLDGWAQAYSTVAYQFHRYYRWTRSLNALERDIAAALERHDTPYALTLGSGAELIAPYATSTNDVSVLVPATARVQDIATAAGLESVDSGDNVTLLVSSERSPLMFRQQIASLQVASDVQLYLDLWAGAGRGREQARHLRAERLTY